MSRRRKVIEAFERLEKELSALVNLETLDDYIAPMKEVLYQCGYHPLQFRQILARNEELMREGMAHGPAITQAVREAGEPARRRTYFWSESLESKFQEHFSGEPVF